MATEDVQEQLLLTLNYQGEDYNVVVDLATAERLVNDPAEAERYVAAAITSSTLEVNSSPPLSPTSSNKQIWQSKGRPSQKDEDATSLLLELRQKYAANFDDKKTIKTQLWSGIAATLCSKGYNVGDGKEGGERCRQKFANLQKQYLGFRKHMKKTGEKKRDPPPFYEELHGLLGAKDKTNPQGLIDTELDEVSSGEETHTTHSEPSTSAESQTTSEGVQQRFSRVKTKLDRPKSTNLLLLQEMKKQHYQLEEQRKREFDMLEKHLAKQNEQREQLLQVLQQLVSKKRKRHNSEQDLSSDSD